ncbi:hypothetical protein ES703_57083 [subsurface metagenome]
MKDETPIYVPLRPTVQTFGEFTMGVKGFKYWLANTGHDAHIQDNIDTIGKFDTKLAKRRADGSHGKRNNVHSTSPHGTLENGSRLLVGLLRVHPVVGWASILFPSGTYKGQMFGTGNVVHCSTMVDTSRELFLI